MTYDPRQFGAKCDLCPLNGCAKPVPPETRASAHIAVIGDYPGLDDIRNDRPFTGPAGVEFDHALEQAGLSRRDLHITNALLCRPPDGKLEAIVAKVQKENRRILKENTQRAKTGGAAFPMKLLPQDFPSFFHRIVHRWYFDAASLAACARHAGLEVIETRHLHRYGMANALAWLRDRRPSGRARLDGISPLADQLWRGYLEDTGQADNLYMLLRRAS